ncbi:hypothetical protein GQ53DRAFT_750121 [Thozetella sp. PMI_491]|nr:hypothetical protein GQ53DRAFT_750121 [Thozetella sp. PMI_491]
MFKTRPLGSLKSIFPPIHQPLPLNKRESQQLLDTLTKSFRRHLDAEHGWISDEGLHSLGPAPTLTYLPTASATPPPPPSRKQHDRRPTDQHLRAILSNPLFSYDGNSAFKNAEASSRTSRDPSDVFEQAVAKGLMTTKRAHGYLLAVRRDVTQSSCISLQEGMRATSAGVQVAQWLRSSGKERALSFTDDVQFTAVLAQFLIAEGRDDLVWSWLDRLAMRAVQAEAARSPALASLLNSLVSAKSLELELDEAYTSMLRGADVFKAHNASPVNLLAAWRNLAFRSTVESWKHSKPPVTLFESFTAIRQQMAVPMRLESAHLDLHHPTMPDAAKAVDFLHTPKIWSHNLPQAVEASKARWARDKNHAPLPNYVIKLMSLALDTVRHMMDSGHSKEAQRTLEFVRANFRQCFDTDPFDTPVLLTR